MYMIYALCPYFNHFVVQSPELHQRTSKYQVPPKQGRICRRPAGKPHLTVEKLVWGGLVGIYEAELSCLGLQAQFFQKRFLRDPKDLNVFDRMALA